MSRLPVVAFGSLVLATVAAFFVTQHLKVTTPLIAGDPEPYPAVISPNGTGCGGLHRVARFSFYLLHRADDVDVYVVDQGGNIIRTLASGRHMRILVRYPDGNFPWNGLEDNGSVAPDGTYYFRIALIHQGRTIELTQRPVTVRSTPPHPVVTSAEPSVIPLDHSQVTIHYTGNENRGGTVMIYRTDLRGGPRLVRSYPTPWHGSQALWNGHVKHKPAPAGTYLIGLAVTDKACNTGHFPPVIPPVPGTTPHAGVTVRYLDAEPPLIPVPAGSTALVHVYSQQPYRWTLQRAGSSTTIAGGPGSGVALHVPLPPARAGLYELAIKSGSYRSAVPLIAGARRAARVLVVLPALTWQGLNPVDDDGDGLPNTLSAADQIDLDRPLADGLPAGFSAEAALLGYLDRSHLHYDLTTDLGLIDGVGPGLAGHSGVVLAGSERWLPASLAAALRSYVQTGGRVLSLGIDSLRRGVTVRGDKALHPTPPSYTDALGARPAAAITHTTAPVTVISDGLRLFPAASAALRGFDSAEAIPSVAAPARVLSAAGASATSPSIVGYRLGGGIVIEIGLPGFGSSLAGNPDSQRLTSSVWTVLQR